MLLSTGKAISEIAYDSRFQDPTTFTVNFHVAFGKSPSEYRLTQLAQMGKQTNFYRKKTTCNLLIFGLLKNN